MTYIFLSPFSYSILKLIIRIIFFSYSFSIYIFIIIINLKSKLYSLALPFLSLFKYSPSNSYLPLKWYIFPFPFLSLFKNSPSYFYLSSKYYFLFLFLFPFKIHLHILIYYYNYILFLFHFFPFKYSPLNFNSPVEWLSKTFCGLSLSDYIIIEWFMFLLFKLELII